MSERSKNNKQSKKKKDVPAIIKYGKRRYSGPRKQLKVGTEAPDEEFIRLNKYIAEGGICSRREADKMIELGAISVNGKTVTQLGTKIRRTDKVQYAGDTIKNEKKVYILLNKPKNFICTLDDPQRRRTIMDLVKNACKERIYPVGRLDRATMGVILLTNDGDLSKKLTHPKHEVKKIYQITTDQPVSQEHFQKISEGIKLDDGFIKPDELAWTKEDSRSELGMEIHSGKNRIVRRIFEHFGYKLIKLDRVYFGGLTKKNVLRGKWKFLDEKEIIMLKMLG